MSWIIKVVLDWLLGKLGSLITQIYANIKAKREREAKNAEVREKTEKAETKEERDEAAEDVIRNF